MEEDYDDPFPWTPIY